MVSASPGVPSVACFWLDDWSWLGLLGGAMCYVLSVVILRKLLLYVCFLEDPAIQFSVLQFFQGSGLGTTQDA